MTCLHHDSILLRRFRKAKVMPDSVGAITRFIECGAGRDLDWGCEGTLGLARDMARAFAVRGLAVPGSRACFGFVAAIDLVDVKFLGESIDVSLAKTRLETLFVACSGLGVKLACSQSLSSEILLSRTFPLAAANRALDLSPLALSPSRLLAFPRICAQSQTCLDLRSSRFDHLNV